MTTITKTSIPGRPRISIGPWSFVWQPRVLATIVIGIIIAATLFVISLTSGDYHLGFGEALKILFTGDAASDLEVTIVRDWRLPRALAGIFAGAALATAGALTQSVTRNALASPDILGITSGASAMAVTVLIVGARLTHQTSVQATANGDVHGAGGTDTSELVIYWLLRIGLPAAAFIGALLTAVVIWILGSYRGLDTYRLVLAGIIITALLNAYMTWLILRADIHEAAIAKTWLTGSLGDSTWHRLWPVIIVMALTLPIMGYASFHLKAVTLGDDSAKSLGVKINTVQIILLLSAVLLSAVSVAACGPIGFVAFVAPQAALRVAGTSTPPLGASAVTGMVLLLGADIVTRTLLPVELPVGIITSAIGGIFLIYLIIRTNQRTTA